MGQNVTLYFYHIVLTCIFPNAYVPARILRVQHRTHLLAGILTSETLYIEETETRQSSHLLLH